MCITRRTTHTCDISPSSVSGMNWFALTCLSHSYPQIVATILVGKFLEICIQIKATPPVYEKICSQDLRQLKIQKKIGGYICTQETPMHLQILLIRIYLILLYILLDAYIFTLD